MWKWGRVSDVFLRECALQCRPSSMWMHSSWWYLLWQETHEIMGIYQVIVREILQVVWGLLYHLWEVGRGVNGEGVNKSGIEDRHCKREPKGWSEQGWLLKGTHCGMVFILFHPFNPNDVLVVSGRSLSNNRWGVVIKRVNQRNANLNVPF